MSIWRQAFLACLCAALAIWWWTQRYGENAAQAAAENRPTLTVRQATGYRYDPQGAKLDTLQADSVQYYHDTRITHFTQPVLRRETANGHLHGQAQHGELSPDGNMRFHGEALMRRFTGEALDIAIRSSSLHYDPAAQTLSSDEEVEFTTPESRTLSRGAVWQLERHYLILKENIRSHYEPSRRR